MTKLSRLLICIVLCFCLNSTARSAADSQKSSETYLVIKEYPGRNPPCPVGTCRDEFHFGVLLILNVDGVVKFVEKPEDTGKLYFQGRILEADLARVKTLVNEGIKKQAFSPLIEMHSPTYELQTKVVHSSTYSDMFMGDQSIRESREGPIGDILKLVRSAQLADRTKKRGKLNAPYYW